MSTAPPWMPLYVGDYLKDTTHLSVVEHGAYLLLLMHCWCNNGIAPLQQTHCQRITKMSDSEWQESGKTVLSFFKKTDNGYMQPRLFLELQKSKDIINKRSNAGKISAKIRWNSNNTCLTRVVTNAQQSDAQSQSQSQEQEQEQEQKVKGDAPNERAFVAPLYEELASYMQEQGFQKPQETAQAFIDFYEVRGWIPSGQRTRMKSWKAAVRTWKRNERRFSENGHFESKQARVRRITQEGSEEFRRRTGLDVESSGDSVR